MTDEEVQLAIGKKVYAGIADLAATSDLIVATKYRFYVESDTRKYEVMITDVTEDAKTAGVAE